MSKAKNRATIEALAADSLIAREIAYWLKPFPAPEWRAPWVERM